MFRASSSSSLELVLLISISFLGGEAHASVRFVKGRLLAFACRKHCFGVTNCVMTLQGDEGESLLRKSVREAQFCT